MSIMVKARNRNAGRTGYVLPDSHIQRTFLPEEEKTLPLEELQQLQWIPGGDYLLRHYLMINDKDALTALNIATEPEYFYTEAEITELLENGTLDQLEDCLNFAPQGVLELVKEIAVKIELPDTRKRKMISEKVGLNIDSAITVNTVMNAESENAEEAPKARKAAPVTASEQAPARKTTPPKYNVVSK